MHPRVRNTSPFYLYPDLLSSSLKGRNQDQVCPQASSSCRGMHALAQPRRLWVVT